MPYIKVRVTVEVTAEEAEIMFDMLKHERMARIKEVGWDVAEATIEVKLIDRLLDQLEAIVVEHGNQIARELFPGEDASDA